MTKQARVEASTRWRKRAGIKQVQINLKPEVVRQWDRLVKEASERHDARCEARGCGPVGRTRRAIEIKTLLCVQHARDIDYGFPVECLLTAA